MDVITYSSWDKSYSMLVKGATGVCQVRYSGAVMAFVRDHRTYLAVTWYPLPAKPLSHKLGPQKNYTTTATPSIGN